MRQTLAMLTLTVVALGCASSSTMNTTTDADAFIRNAGPRFISAFNSGNAAAVSDFYTSDAVLMMPNQQLSKGSAVIREVYSGFLSANKPTLSFVPDRIVQSGDVAYEYGHYTMSMTPSGGNAMADQGNYITVWRRQPNGDWKIAVDSIATSMPMRQ